MTIVATFFPTDGTTGVDINTIAVTTPITISLVTDAPPINTATITVSLNGDQIVSAGLDTSGRFSSTITPTATTALISITFDDPSDRFNSFETININVSASDSTSSFSEGFSFRIEDIDPPVLDAYAPAPNSDDNAPDTPIFFRITDVGSGVDESTLTVFVNETGPSGTSSFSAVSSGVIDPAFSTGSSITKIGNDIDVLLTRDTEYLSSAQMEVLISVSDESNTLIVPNADPVSFEFSIIDVQPPIITNLIPGIEATNVAETSTISLTFRDENGSGIDLTSVNITLNGLDAVVNGQLQSSLLNLSLSMIITTPFPSSTDFESVTFILKTIDDLSSARPVQVVAQGRDNRGNDVSLIYSFRVRDYLPPRIEKTFPADANDHILPSTDIRFKIIEESDGYGVDFDTLSVEVDGYSVINQTRFSIPVDGYLDDFLGRTFLQPFEDGYLITPEVFDDAYDAYLTYPGFLVTIDEFVRGEYSFIIDPLNNFEFEQTVPVRINVSDRGGHFTSEVYAFITATEGEIITTAFPDTGTFKNFIDGYGLKDANKFLYETGVTLTTNLPDTITFYTTDGSIPVIDACNQVLGTTQVFTKPIIINREGLNALKFFSIDSAGNEESLKQEVYMIDIIPPEIREVLAVRIVADIPFPTAVIPVETTQLFRTDELVRILDDAIPPILTKILTVNETSDPPFLIIDDQVAKLKVSRNARVEKTEQPIDPQIAIEFDTANIPGFMYIGSDGLESNQADSVFEEFRVLNKASTDEEILADFTLLAKGERFANQDEPVLLSSTEFSALERERVNLPDNTLVLLHFDGNVENEDRRGVLTNNTTPVVDTFAAANDIIFIIFIKEGEFVDRELLREVLEGFAPADLNVIVRYEEIP